MRRTTRADFILRHQKIHGIDTFDYSLVPEPFLGMAKHVELKCNKCGKTVSQIPRNTIHGKAGCPSCSGNRKKTAEEWRKSSIEAAKKAGNSDDYSKFYPTSQTGKSQITCNECGEIYLKRPKDILSGKIGHPKCKRVGAGLKRQTTREDIIAKSVEINGKNRYGYDRVPDRARYTDKIELYCFECEDYFQQTIREHFAGHGCQECGGNRRPSLQERKTNIKKVHPNVDLSKWVVGNSKQKSLVKHTDCGHSEPASYDRLYNRKIRCRTCSYIKRGEELATHRHIFKSLSLQTHGEIYRGYDSLPEKIRRTDKITLHCTRCDESFTQKSGDHLSGHGCQKCAGNYRHTVEERRQMIHDVNTQVKDLSEWSVSNANEKSKVTFNCGHSYDASFNSIFHCKSGCHVCNPGGINYDDPAYLYSMEVWNGTEFLVHKTGICQEGNLEQRRKQIESGISKDLGNNIRVRVKRIVHFKTAREAEIVENEITGEIHDMRFKEYRPMVGAGREFTTECGIFYALSQSLIEQANIVEMSQE